MIPFNFNILCVIEQLSQQLLDDHEYFNYQPVPRDYRLLRTNITCICKNFFDEEKNMWETQMQVNEL